MDGIEILILGLIWICGIIVTLVFWGLLILVVGYVILWLLQNFGILQHFGIGVLMGVL